ncbi:hypothetical protein [Aeromonas veronii]|uniref:hypothetical protein n=1 Tax=Aeromonas veronii TaxID=654 RepID=UPI003D205924
MLEQPSLMMNALTPNIGIIIISFFGGIVLFGIKLSEHFVRPPADKLPLEKYIGFVIFLFISLPTLGAGVTCIYLLNGDKISTILAFQIGLTSPAIVQSLIIAAANNMAQKVSPTLQENQ